MCLILIKRCINICVWKGTTCTCKILEKSSNCISTLQKSILDFIFLKFSKSLFSIKLKRKSNDENNLMTSLRKDEQRNMGIFGLTISMAASSKSTVFVSIYIYIYIDGRWWNLSPYIYIYGSMLQIWVGYVLKRF